MDYFEKLPIISYNGQIARNILASTQLTDNSKKQNILFHPYTVRDDDRADILAYRYYDDPHYAWLVWYSNQTIDPYYGIGVSDDDLLRVIEAKYGSVERSQSTILYYRNDWVGDDTEVTLDRYASLPGVLKKYYDARLNDVGSVVSYLRKRKEMIRSTNKMISLSVTGISGTFTVGEKIQYINNGSIVASAFITYIDTVAGTITAQHVTGSFSAGNTIIGRDSTATALVTSQTLLQQLISDVEYPYWSAVTAYDYETEKNNNARQIVLIDNTLKGSVENQLAKVLG